MKITNKYNLPQPLVNVVEANLRGYKRREISCTELIGPPQIRMLMAKHGHEIEEDVSDNIDSLLGTAVHYILEQGSEDHHTTEETLSIELRGWVLTGTPDLLDGTTLSDYKIVKAYSIALGDKPEWIAQCNIYAYLRREHESKVDKAQIVAILKDWDKFKAMQDKGYPQKKVVVKEVDLWSNMNVLHYINGRLHLHQLAEDGEQIDCTDEERWKRPDQWAVTKIGNKRATRVYDTADKAHEDLNKRPEGKFEVQYREGEYVRCEGYCSVKPFCQQWAKDKMEDAITKL